jgi:hypothetical protein
MPTEEDLRAMFDRERHAESKVGTGLDARLVIRRSRVRRLPKQLAAGGGGVLVLAGVTVLGLQSLNLPPQQAADAPLSQESSQSGPSREADDSALSGMRAPALQLNLCGQPVADVEPNGFGLVVEVVFPATASASAERIDGNVIVTNQSTEPVTGTALTDPAITLAQDGITVWHTNGPTDSIGTRVDLAPGASMKFPASFEPVRCAPGDDALEAFRPDLPSVGAGTYQVSAALDFLSDQVGSDQVTETSETFPVSGPGMPIVLE